MRWLGAGRVAWTISKWVWWTAINVFYLLVVWYVLEQLSSRPEKVIVPILGLIYVTIRSIAYSNGYIIIQLALILDDTNNNLNRLIDPSYERDLEQLNVTTKRMQSNQALSYVDLAGFGLNSLLCLFYLFTAI